MIKLPSLSAQLILKSPQLCRQRRPASLQRLQTANSVLKGDLNIFFRAQLGAALPRSARSRIALRMGAEQLPLQIARACFSRQENECQPQFCSGLEKENEAAPMFNSLSLLPFDASV